MTTGAVVALSAYWSLGRTWLDGSGLRWRHGKERDLEGARESSREKRTERKVTTTRSRAGQWLRRRSPWRDEEEGGGEKNLERSAWTAGRQSACWDKPGQPELAGPTRWTLGAQLPHFLRVVTMATTCPGHQMVLETCQ
jgi:hypothetical protein